jgi:XTP/dITP diphosphohydrolase
MTILYASTTNAGKLREFLHAAAEANTSDFAIELLPGIRDIVPPEENGETFEANSVLKAVYYSRFTKGLVFADDSGLVVDALGGAPGVRSARFAGEHATDAENNALVLKQLETVSDRRARFVCVISLAQDGRVLHTSRGTVEGELLREPRGRNGFGYDPLFFCHAVAKTLAEATQEEKFQVSHRGNALRVLFEWLKRNQASFVTGNSGTEPGA